jgi:hypothetical protein
MKKGQVVHFSRGVEIGEKYDLLHLLSMRRCRQSAEIEFSELVPTMR